MKRRILNWKPIKEISSVVLLERLFWDLLGSFQASRAELLNWRTWWVADGSTGEMNAWMSMCNSSLKTSSDIIPASWATTRDVWNHKANTWIMNLIWHVLCVSPESAGKDAWSRVPLVQAAPGSARVRCRLHRPRRQIKRLCRRSVRVPFTHHIRLSLYLWPTHCVYITFQIPSQPGICTPQGSQLYLSRPGAK